MTNPRCFRVLVSVFIGLSALLATPAGARLGVVWTRANADAPWKSNLSAPTAVSLNNLLWASPGGWGTRQPYALWRSSNGTTWINVAEVPLYNQQFHLVVFKGQLWALGHRNAAGAIGQATEAWSSPDGLAWTRKCARLPAFWRNPNCLVAFDDKLWIIGGNDGSDDTAFQSVFSSTDGITWTLVADQFPKGLTVNGLRYDFATAVFGDKLWLLGGTTDATRRDVWWTTNGKDWTQAIDAAEWPQRANHAAVTFDDRLYVLGGRIAEWYHDVWSSTDGVRWRQENAAADWSTRASLCTLICQNKLWVLGGLRPRGTTYEYLADVWYSWMLPEVPVIEPVADQTMTEGPAYTGPTPMLNEGTRPITWSLVEPPAGLTVEPATGVTQWPGPRVGVEPYLIRLRASNAYGADETSWSLTVLPQTPPVLGAPTFAKGTQATVTWTAVPYVSGYTLQRAATADFAAPQETVDLSSTTLTHTFRGLKDDTTYWYRVRGRKVAGLTSLWSAAAACTQDATPPTGQLAPEQSLGIEAPAGVLRMVLWARDPGRFPSGLHQVRHSLDQQHWTPWQPVASRLSLWVGNAVTTTLYAQLADRTGNIRLLSASASIPRPAVLHVDDDNTSGPWQGTRWRPYRRIQDALDATDSGATIVVAPGAYRENINFKGKIVRLRSADPLATEIVKATVIDGHGAGPVVTFKGTETEACVLEGFTIRGGKAKEGAGILGHHTRATIQFNRIVDNQAYDSSSSGPDEIGNSYTNYEGYGGGLATCDGPIHNNIIAGNRAGGPPPWSFISTSKGLERPPGDYFNAYFSGGAFFDCAGPIRNNTIWNNTTDLSYHVIGPLGVYEEWGEGVIVSCSGAIQNNIIWGNQVHPSDVPQVEDSSVPMYCCISDVYNPDAHLVDTDPLLVDPAGGDFRLRPGSPCVDAGKFIRGLGHDAEGEVRGYNGVAPTRGDGSDFDIGADEFLPLATAVWVTEPVGGEVFSDGARVLVRWRAITAQAGTKVRLALYRGASQVADLGEGVGGADGQVTVTLPPANSIDCRIRVTSQADPVLYGQSPPFQIFTRRNAASPALWQRYR